MTGDVDKLGIQVTQILRRLDAIAARVTALENPMHSVNAGAGGDAPYSYAFTPPIAVDKDPVADKFFQVRQAIQVAAFDVDAGMGGGAVSDEDDIIAHGVITPEEAALHISKLKETTAAISAPASETCAAAGGGAVDDDTDGPSLGAIAGAELLRKLPVPETPVVATSPKAAEHVARRKLRLNHDK